jgi:Rieske Fe-S protein
MGDPSRRDPAPAADPLATPVTRRRVLVLLGVGALAAGGGLGVLLEACAATPVTVRLSLDPTTLVPATPVQVPFTLTSGGSTVEGSAWLVKLASGDLVAFDPRCTHARCPYAWSAAEGRFDCACHPGQFALDGSVIAGPPRRPLDRFPVRLVGDVIELDVPSDFDAPREAPSS